MIATDGWTALQDGRPNRDLIPPGLIVARWFAEAQAAIEQLERVSQTLTRRVKQLADRYAKPLPVLMEDVETLAARVDTHLERMGLAWK